MNREAMARGSWLRDRNSAAALRPTEFPMFDRRWELMDGVFAPVFCLSTQLFTDWIPYPVGGRFLEIGCGAGVTAVMAAVRGCAEVVATDLSEAAVANAARNVARHDVADVVRVVRGDLFASLPAGERFDVVFWNSSFIESPPDAEHRDDLDRAIFDPGYRTHRRFLSEVRSWLAPDGRVLLGFSTLGNEAALRAMARAAGMEVQVMAESPPGLVPGMAYRLLELCPKEQAR